MRREPIQIDRDKLRAAIRKLGNEYIFYMLSDAIDLLPRPNSRRSRRSTSIEAAAPGRGGSDEVELARQREAF